MRKSIALLYMLETLETRGRMEKRSVTDKLQITDVSFYRYLKSIRNYLMFMRDGRELIYDRNNDIYVLVRKATN